MRTPNGLYFAPSIRFKELNLDDPEALAIALDRRIENWYLDPAEKIVRYYPFASGTLLVCFVDYAAGLIHGRPPTKRDVADLLEEATREFRELDPRRSGKTLAISFVDFVRNGLVHNARLSCGAQFSVDCEATVEVVNGILIVNPNNLVKELRRVWKTLLVAMRVSL